MREKIPLEEIDGYVADEFGEPVIEFRACLSDYVTIPGDVAQFSMDIWLTEPNFHRVLAGNWERIGVGLDWG